MINNKAKEGRKVFFIHGGVDAEDREEVRKITETEDDTSLLLLWNFLNRHQHQEPSQRDLCLSIKIGLETYNLLVESLEKATIKSKSKTV